MLSEGMGRSSSLQAWRRTALTANEWIHIAWVWGPRDGIIPNRYVEMLVGARPGVLLAQAHLAGGAAEGAVRAVWPVWTNFFASVFGAFMYFATLTEVPILQGLIGSGMGKGPALALLLAGPALSLPNMLVIAGVMGVRKTAVYVTLVVVMATVSGLVFGAIAG